MSSTFWRLLPFRLPRFLRRRQDTDYEVILQKLNEDIAKIQTKLTHIRARQRRAAITFTAYALGAWALYTLVCYALGELHWEPLPLDGGSDPISESLFSTRTIFVWFPILLSPILILFTRRIFAWWYKRIETAEEAHLQSLRKRQRAKIAEIKRATDFDHLRMLLDKYDEDRPRGPAGQQKNGPRQSLPANANPSAPQQGPAPQQRGSGPRHSIPANFSPSQQQMQQAQLRASQGRTPGAPSDAQKVQAQQGQGANAAALQQQQQQQQQLQTPVAFKRTPLDKFADWMFGPDPSLGGGTGVSAAMQKYALICSRCLAHNGLAMPQEFDEIQYICPKCGAFNSRRPSSTPVSAPSFFTRNSPQSSPKQNVNRGLAANNSVPPSKPSSPGLPSSVTEQPEEEEEDAKQDQPAGEQEAGTNEAESERRKGLRQRNNKEPEAMDTD
ncbi:hypothetical protein OC846_002742 [Tilletia horrida]|uniref:Endoplasmic reticulum junction formation protein lunapark n=1 Tax=Tilletia horrida TaxID=155126 RepID=A0AAN6GT30_9BASI|nr:hypothetical protein OC846_002742 [Tilletia horrida]KAK0561689.1 hypothetical protein OC861_005695 [Tilletia horrida]